MEFRQDNRKLRNNTKDIMERDKKYVRERERKKKRE